MHVDLIIIGIFVILTIIIGFYCGKNIATFQDYAVGNRKMCSFILAISIIATNYGSRSLTYGVDVYYQKGLYYLMSNIAHIVGLYLVLRFIIIRMKGCIGHLSIAESIGSLYGPIVRTITGFFCIVFSTCILIAQLKVGLSIILILYPEIEQFFPHSAIILPLLVIGYSTFGGARAVVLTDVYQFFLFGICFYILIFMSLRYVKHPLAHLQKFITITHFNINHVLTFHNIFTWVSVALPCAFLSIFDPPCFQRFYMASSIQQATKALYKRIMIEIILIILFFSLVVAVHLGNHNIPTNQHVIDYLMQLGYFPGIRGILVTAIIALLMSTADSSLHTAAVLFTNDILPVMLGSTKHASQYSLRTVRIFSIFIGLISIFMMSYQIDFLALFEIIDYCYLACTIPLIMASFGFRLHSTAVLFNMGINMVIPLIFNQSMLEAVAFNLFILIVTHYLLPKRPSIGWIGTKDFVDLQNQETKRWWLSKLQDCKLLFTKSYWQDLFPKQESTFVLLGIYLIISTFVSLCCIQATFVPCYIYWYILVIVFGITLVACSSCCSYKHIGSPILKWVWPVLLFLLFFVSSIQFAKLSHFKPIVCLLFIYSISLGIMLFSLKIGVIMLVIAIIAHKFIPPSIPFWSSLWTTKMSLEFVFTMPILVTTLIGFGLYIYLREKIKTKFNIIALARYYERRAALELIYNQMNWTRLNPIYSRKTLREIDSILQTPCSYLYSHGQVKLGAEINRFMNQLKKFRRMLLTRVKEEHTLALHKKSVQQVDIDGAILKADSTMLALGATIELFVRNQTKVRCLVADPFLFERLLTINLFKTSTSAQAVDDMVTLAITDAVLRYDTTLTLPALAFLISTDASVQNVQLIYDVTDNVPYTHLPKSENQLYQAESRQIVQAHGGYATIIDTQKVLTHCYVLPVAGQKVMRFKTYDPSVLGNKIIETAESLAQEQELIELLTMETELTKEIVEKTITFIKNAHGFVTRKSGAPYYTHPMEVAKILLEITKDPATILAGLLHDIVEDTPVPLTQVELMYDPQVAYIVDMVTHYHTDGYRWKLDDQENKKLLDQCKDIRVVQVKLADRLHNIRTLHFREIVDQKRIAKETINFYIPWAKRNKISKWILEMSYICEEVLNKKG